MELPFFVEQWLVEPELNRVRGPLGIVQLEPRTMRVLNVLAETPGQVVSRDQLLSTVWADAVVTEHSLTIAISDLRKLFEDDPKNPQFIETIRGVGYRLIAPIRFETPSLYVGNAQGDGFAAADLPVVSQHTTRKINHWLIVGAGIGGLALVAMAILFFRPAAQAPIQQISPLTSQAGVEVAPVFSPDGGRVAYAAFHDGGKPSSLFVKQIGVDNPVALTDFVGAELHPTWSPDGQHLAYYSHSPSGCAIFKIASYGGAPSKIRDVPCGSSNLNWTTDGQSLIYSSYEPGERSFQIFALDLNSNEQRALTQPSSAIRGDVSVTIAPDGNRIAFLRAVDGLSGDIFIRSINNVEDERRITHDGVTITGFDWTPDGKALIVASNRQNRTGLYRFDLGGRSEPELIRAVPVQDPGSIALDRSSDQMVFTDWTYEINTWRQSLVRPENEASIVASSTRSDFQPSVAPDGRLAYVSSRTGNPEIWVSKGDGAEPVKLTNRLSHATQYPTWSPDGKRIAFESRTRSQSDLFIIDAEGGIPERITSSSAHDLRPMWAPDGKSLFFGSDRSGSWQIWRKDLENGEATQVTVSGGFRGAFSETRQALFYTRQDTSGIWEKRLPDGEEHLFVSADPVYWTLTDQALFYAMPLDANLSLKIQRYDLNSGSTEEVASIELDVVNMYTRWGFSISPDENWMYFSQVDRCESDLMLTRGSF